MDMVDSSPYIRAMKGKRERTAFNYDEEQNRTESNGTVSDRTISSHLVIVGLNLGEARTSRLHEWLGRDLLYR